jgi:hypothetical protein
MFVKSLSPSDDAFQMAVTENFSTLSLFTHLILSLPSSPSWFQHDEPPRQLNKINK